jgi:predicted ATP-dependent endonuclease of OLD family
MITSIKIDNFKSLIDFELPLSKFNCLVGLNGAGKSTVLQAIDFLSQLVKGDITGWLEQRQWDKSDLNSKLTKKSNIDFAVELTIPHGNPVKWSGSFNRRSLSCTREILLISDCLIFKVVDGRVSVTTDDPGTKLLVEYEGSLISRLKLDDFPIYVHQFKSVMLRINSLDLISPALLRKSHKTSGGQLGLGGEKLSSYIHESGKANKDNLTKLLQKVYGQLDGIETSALRSGSKELSITEHFGGTKLKSNAGHINDGMLRLMAILSQLTNSSDFLLFDEIENGINPELIEFLMDLLVDTNHQVLITTHSPMVLNFLEDDVAKDGVIYLYKAQDGATKACKLFDIPSLKEKLNVMGPGEAFIDTDLTELYKEIIALPQNSEE